MVCSGLENLFGFLRNSVLSMFGFDRFQCVNKNVNLGYKDSFALLRFTYTYYIYRIKLHYGKDSFKNLKENTGTSILT